MTEESDIILYELKLAIERQQSPWCNRRQAASYAACSVAQVDRAANEGKIKRHEGTGVPTFKKSELDAWVEGGKK